MIPEPYLLDFIIGPHFKGMKVKRVERKSRDDCASGVVNMLLEQKKGIIRTANIISAGISKPYFAEYVEKCGLESVSHGIYVSKHAWMDPITTYKKKTEAHGSTPWFAISRHQRCIWSRTKGIHNRRCLYDAGPLF